MAAFAVAGLPEAARAAKYAAVVADASSGDVLYARHADSRRYPASLTKIMTLYLVFEALERGTLKLDDKLPVSSRAVAQPPSRLGLRAGGTIEVEDAILALTTKSANDVAVAVAERLGGTESRFARLMTEKARELGMSRTVFRNASGLPDDRQVTTARDMLTLSRALLRRFPDRFKYFSAERFTFNGRTYHTHNHLLGSFDGTDGIKTGYINASGFNLVASVVRDGQRLIGVVFGGKTASRRDNHMRMLLESGFARLATMDALAVAPLPLEKPAAPTQVARAEPSPTDDADETDPAAATFVNAPAAPWPPRKPATALALLEEPGWKVQVGAFESYDSARLRALRAAALVGEMLRSPRIAVEPVGGGDVQLYRAQLIAHDARRAELACEALKRQRMDCFTIPPESALEG